MHLQATIACATPKATIRQLPVTSLLNQMGSQIPYIYEGAETLRIKWDPETKRGGLVGGLTPSQDIWKRLMELHS